MARECAPLRPDCALLGKGRRPRRRTAPRPSWPTPTPASTAAVLRRGTAPGHQASRRLSLLFQASGVSSGWVLLLLVAGGVRP
jgi:hypothetical protein